MSFDDVITLVWYVANGNQVTENTIDILANEGPVKRAEFYAAYQSSMTLNKTFTINECDYELSKTIDPDTNKPKYAKQLKFRGATYEIIREYPKDGFVELVCS